MERGELQRWRPMERMGKAIYGPVPAGKGWARRRPQVTSQPPGSQEPRLRGKEIRLRLRKARADFVASVRR